MGKLTENLECRCQNALAGLQVETVILPDGEEYKSLEVLSKVWDTALEKRLNRKCTFVALGGGVIGDMAGFAAASYQRGVNFVQVRKKATLVSSGGQYSISAPEQVATALVHTRINIISYLKIS